MIHQYADIYLEALFNDVIPFWSKYSLDQKYGGYLTCMDRAGNVYDTDKFVWLQARQVWTYAMLYDELKKEAEWLSIALHGAEFLEKYGRDSDGNWFFALSQEGKPLVQAYNIFSDCFACLAFARLFQITGESEYAEIALHTYKNIDLRKDNPKGIYNKVVPGTRPMHNFSLPMILCNLSLEMKELLDPEVLEKTIKSSIYTILNQFYDPDTGLTLENVSDDGKLSDTFDGRLINPGHAIEAMWFLMDLGAYLKDTALINTAKDRALFMLEYGWDKEYGGIFYFMDRLGKPLVQLEWDQKLWWVHLEALIAMAKGFQLTGNPRCAQWFEKAHKYTWSRFPDPEHGEWYGYLKRDGAPLSTMKGGKWKGCFHVPRGLWQVYQVLSKSESK